MVERYSFIFNEKIKRVDLFLSEKLTNYSRNQIIKFIKNGNILLNNELTKKSVKLKAGDKISIEIPPPVESTIIPQKMDLNILYEDDTIIVIDKKQGVIVHPGAGNPDNTLVNGILHHCKNLEGIGGVLRPGVVHRIDKDTSGVIIFAKTQYALNHIAAQFKEHSNIRKYLALVKGDSGESGKIETFISRSPKNRIKFTSKTDSGKWAISNYKKIKSFNHFSLIEVTLETGRTHQIRVHFSDRFNPILGDPLYGPDFSHYKFLNHNIYRKIKLLKGQLLHAKFLEIEHPVTKNRVSFSSKPHQDFLEILELLEEFDL